MFKTAAASLVCFKIQMFAVQNYFGEVLKSMLWRLLIKIRVKYSQPGLRKPINVIKHLLDQIYLIKNLLDPRTNFSRHDWEKQNS